MFIIVAEERSDKPFGGERCAPKQLRRAFLVLCSKRKINIAAAQNYRRFIAIVIVVRFVLVLIYEAIKSDHRLVKYIIVPYFHSRTPIYYRLLVSFP